MSCIFNLNQEVADHPIWRKYGHTTHFDAKFMVIGISADECSNGQAALVKKNCKDHEEALDVRNYLRTEQAFIDSTDPRIDEVYIVRAKDNIKDIKFMQLTEHMKSLEDTEYSGLHEFMYSEGDGNMAKLERIVIKAVGWDKDNLPNRKEPISEEDDEEETDEENDDYEEERVGEKRKLSGKADSISLPKKKIK